MRSNAARLLPEFREFQRRNGAPSHYRHLAITSRTTPQRRPGTADAATPGATHCRLDARPCRPATRTTQRGASAADRAADLSALSARAADLHPHAHPPAGDGSMIGTTRFHRYPLLLSRAPARHRDPLSPPQSTGLTLARMIRRPSNNAAPDHDPAVVLLRRRRPTRDRPPGYQPSWMKSP